MGSVFTKIIQREIPAHVIVENDEFFAFLDINPLVLGHTLVVPKLEVDYIYDLEDDILGRMHVFAKGVAKAVERAIPCERIGISVIGLEVPHAHIHLVPMNSADDLNFTRMKLDPSNEELAGVAKRIIAEL